MVRNLRYGPRTRLVRGIYSTYFPVESNGKARGRGVLPYMSYIGMCGPKGCGFSAGLVINRVSILADFGHK